MKKGYLDDLSEWLDSHPKIRQGLRNHVKIAFLTVKDDVKTALDSGYPMSVVWKHMRDTGKLNCSYDTFCRHVQRYIRQPADEGKAANSSPTAKTSASEETSEVKIAEDSNSAESETAELEPWEKKFKIAEEKIAAMKKKHPNFRINPKPIPENDKALAKKEILPVAKSDGQEQKKEPEIDDNPWAERMQKLREVREKHKIKSFQWNPVPMTMAEIIRGKRDDPKEKSQKDDSQARKDQERWPGCD